MTNIDDVLARLNPKTAESFRKASEITVELLPTPSLGINMAINGLRYGGFTTLWGNRGCGKTTFALGAVAEAQKNGKTAAWIDVEKNFTPAYARRLGADPDKMIVDNKTISIAGATDKCKDLLLAGVDVIVIDSISQLLPQSYFEDPKDEKKLAAGAQKEIKALSQTGQIGTFAKNIGQMLNILNGVNENACIILISQVRNNIGSYGASKTFMGGEAMQHASSTVIKLWRTPSETITQEVHVGDGLLLNKVVAAPVTWTIDKNRGPGMHESNSYDLYFGGDNIGIDLTSEVVTYGVEYGVIKKGGAWFTVGDERFQGRPKVIEYLRQNPDIQEKIYGEILAKSV